MLFSYNTNVLPRFIFNQIFKALHLRTRVLRLTWMEMKEAFQKWYIGVLITLFLFEVAF